MPKVKQYLDEISSYVTTWITQIAVNNALTYYDINKISEGTSLHLLNLLYGYQLVDLNNDRQNFPGIDLGDKSVGKLAVQVSSRTDASKIKSTLQTFHDNSYLKEYPNGIRFLLLSDNRRPILSSKVLSSFGDFFDSKTDIILIRDLLQQIKQLYYDDQLLFENIRQFLEQEFGEHGLLRKNSLISFQHRAEKVVFYKELFIANQQSVVKNFVPIQYIVGDQFFSTDGLSQQLLDLKGLIIYGPSGCGKSVLGKQLAVELINNIFPVVLDAKYYDTNLVKLFNKEINAYGFNSDTDFLTHVVRSEQQVLLIVDGLNECPAELRLKLLLEIKKVVSDWNIKLIVTTQESDPALEELALPSIYIQYPSAEIKMAIALAHGQQTARKKLIPILNIVSTGLEAKMAGEIGTALTHTDNRFSLFESFIKKKLGDNHLGGFFLLSSITKLMSEKITFSLANRTVETLLLKHGLSLELYRHCLKSGVLEEQSDKISFGHEMFFNFFVADSVARFASDALEILEALNAPKNTDKKLLIIGSIEDQKLLDEVLTGLTDSNLFDLLLEGEGGEYCKLWAEKKIKQLLPRIAVEISNCRFEFAETPHNFQCVEDGLQNWSDQELALLLAIPGRLVKGELLREIFDLIEAMDNVCTKSVEEFWEEGKARGISTRSSIFLVAYSGIFERHMAITRILKSLQSGYFHMRDKIAIHQEQLEQLIDGRELKPGQIYLLLLLLRFDNRLRVLYPTTLRILNRWRYTPSNLLMEILQQIGFIYENEEQRGELIKVINTIHSETQNIWLSTTIFDALSALGELEEDANNYISVVKDEIAGVLSNPNDQSACEYAAGIFFRQYDHPYSPAYYTAIDNLPSNEKALFFRMALQGEHSSMFTISLILKVYQTIGASAMQYLVRWTDTPFIQPSFPVDSLALFFIVHLLLGRNDYPLSQRDNMGHDKKERSVRALAEIFYWGCRTDIESECRNQHYQKLGEVLFNAENNYVVETIWQAKRALYQQNYYRELNLDIIQSFELHFRNQITEACRHTLKDLDWQESIWQHGSQKTEINLNAISLLEEHGTLIDIDVLRPLADDKIYGRYAVGAIRKLGG